MAAKRSEWRVDKLDAGGVASTVRRYYPMPTRFGYVQIEEAEAELEKRKERDRKRGDARNK